MREQLGRVISSALFRNSKRFPAFLRYTVEHALSSGESLKERTIGHEVFGRDASYDTSQDPVVRMTAAEVRKRLVQYYEAPERAAELAITYQPGSYVPEFLPPSNPVVPDPVVPEIVEPPSRSRGRSALALAAVVTVVAIVLAITLTGPRAVPATSAVDRFWAPIVDSPSPVLLCIGDPSLPLVGNANNQTAAEVPGELTISEFLRANSVRYTDSVTLALLAGELRIRQKPFRIRRPAATELKDLREGPVVLIGGFNNPWTVKLTEGLRFVLTGDATSGNYIKDRDRPESREWQIGNRDTSLQDVKKTFGLITRFEDPATGHTVVSVSGLVLGTRAAGECMLDAQCLQSAETLAGGALGRRNTQIVVEAAVIGEDSGAPRVLAAHLW